VIWIECCWLPTREGIFCQNVFSSWGLSSFGLNQYFLFVEKKKTQTEVGDLWIHSTANYWEQSCRQVMLLPKFLSRKKLSRKYRSISVTPVAGLIFWGKNRAIFSGELFSGEEFLPRTAFPGKKCRSICSNQVISWYGSSAVDCPLGREFSAKTCSLLGGFLISV